ncbi:DUF2867 domain-containing protein [Streptomyces sp. NPDC050636]|uniref:DUF2867 domain-containing protein n=1 Tax=Streptomyces sp. NPDC050636 TaxID=3154510 RepID=UPI003418176A
MNIIEATPELASVLSGADHIDVKTAESAAPLREFVAGAVNWRPGWVRALFRARAVLARLLRLRESDIPSGRLLRPEEISFAAGSRIAFFTVTDASEDQYVVLEATDSHLTGRLAVVRTPLTDGRARFEVTTVVTYHRWTGPFYFNVIRPFHHLVVVGMTKAGARSAPGTPEGSTTS